MIDKKAVLLQSMTEMLFTVDNFNSRTKSRRRETVTKVNYVGI